MEGTREIIFLGEGIEEVWFMNITKFSSSY